MSKKSETIDSRKRGMLMGAAGVAGLVAATGVSPARADQNDAKKNDISAAINGVYEKAELRQPNISVSAIQSRVRAVDIKNLKTSLKSNMDHFLMLIDYAQGTPEYWDGERRWGSRQDLLCMHEFPIQGFQAWTREELKRVAFDLPGPESEAIGQRAKLHNCYIAFGCYAKDKDWPDHVINMSVIVGPDGNIVAKHWKARNILGLFGDNALIGTTVYDVLDRYVEMYGWDATLPVARTDIGNIAMTAVGAEPMIYQCLALKGAEILIMSVTGGSNASAAIEAAKTNRIYTVGVGNSVSPDNIGFLEATGAQDGGTVIVDPKGYPLAETTNHHEDIASTRIPIADFRATRRFREVPASLIVPVLQAYQPKFKPNAFLGKLPATYKEAGDLVRKQMSE